MTAQQLQRTDLICNAHLDREAKERVLDNAKPSRLGNQRHVECERREWNGQSRRLELNAVVESVLVVCSVRGRCAQRICRCEREKDRRPKHHEGGGSVRRVHGWPVRLGRERGGERAKRRGGWWRRGEEEDGCTYGLSGWPMEADRGIGSKPAATLHTTRRRLGSFPLFLASAKAVLRVCPFR
jgi:hypothetical protein